MALPSVRQGNALTLAVREVKETNVIYYQDEDYAIYEIRPSSNDNKLVGIFVEAHNPRATTIIMFIDEEGYILLDKDNNQYASLNPFGETRRLVPNPPNDWEPHQFIWSRSPSDFEIPRGNSITAWAVFDVPKGIQPHQLRWHALETIFVPFYPIGS